MNIISAKLKNIISCDNLNLLEFEKDKEKIKVLILQLNINLKIGDDVLLYIKPTKLFLSSSYCDFENVLKVKIKKVKRGKILASVLCELLGDEIEVIMLNEKIDFESQAYLMFKASDISIIGKMDD